MALNKFRKVYASSDSHILPHILLQNHELYEIRGHETVSKLVAFYLMLTQIAVHYLDLLFN